MTERAAIVSLDAMPAHRDLAAAASHGLTLAAWRAVGAPPVSKSSPPRKSRKWAPTGHQRLFRSKWECEYAELLELRRCADEIDEWAYEPVRLTLGGPKGPFYTPDFRVRSGDHVEWHEVKGYAREAAIVRLKVAAARYPEDAFILVTKKQGQWCYRRISP